MRKAVVVSLVAVVSFVKLLIRKYWAKAHKIRWAYLAFVPVIILTVFILFEWAFVEHLLLAMGVEALLHHLTAAAIGDEVADVAADVVEKVI